MIFVTEVWMGMTFSFLAKHIYGHDLQLPCHLLHCDRLHERWCQILLWDLQPLTAACWPAVPACTWSKRHVPMGRQAQGYWGSMP